MICHDNKNIQIITIIIIIINMISMLLINNGFLFGIKAA